MRSPEYRDRMLKTLDSLTIEQPATKRHETPGKGWWVCGFDRFPRGSVLEGQDRWQRVEHFDTVEAAQEAWPTVEVIDHSTRPLVPPSIGPQPAGWYGPDGGFSDCGEHWDEQ